MNKTILFIASELPKSESARCLDLSKLIQNHLDNCKVRDFFILRKWEQPKGEEILNQISTRPAYIQYCGHGNEFGDWQLPAYQEGREKPYSFDLEEIRAALESNNLHLECLLFGSCNSDLWVKSLQKHADFSIGFSNSPSAELVHEFYDKFYAHLIKNGDPLKAYWTSKRKIKSNKNILGKSSQDQPEIIFMSRHNYVMELLKQSDSILEGLEGKVAETIAELDEIKHKMAHLSAEEFSTYDQLLYNHPFGRQVIEFMLSKELLSSEIASDLCSFEGEYNDLDIEILNNKILMLFEVIEFLLLGFEEVGLARKEAKPLLAQLSEIMSYDEVKKVFNRLISAESIRSNPSIYNTYLTSIRDYCLLIIKPKQGQRK